MFQCPALWNMATGHYHDKNKTIKACRGIGEETGCVGV